MKKVTQYKGVEIIGVIQPEKKKVTLRDIKCVFNGEIFTTMVTSLAYAHEAIDNALNSGVAVDSELNALSFADKNLMMCFLINPFMVNNAGQIVGFRKAGN